MSGEENGDTEDDGPCPEWDTSTGTSYDSDTIVVKDISYHCPICGNDSYGEVHSDCARACAKCRRYYANDKIKTFEREDKTYDGESLCKHCYLDEIDSEEELPEKEPEE